jgi:hypothetical protein
MIKIDNQQCFFFDARRFSGFWELSSHKIADFDMHDFGAA